MNVLAHFIERYGLAEAGPMLTTNAISGVAKPGSVGRALPGVELRLVDGGDGNGDGEDDDDYEDDDGDGADAGLVSVRGPHLFSGYWPDGAGGPDAEGWFRTPDVGFLDADGDLHLLDRSTDLVIVNGFPDEVEQMLAELPVKAVLVRAAVGGPTPEGVREHCALRLARFKVPTVIEFRDVLPRTPTGKVARRQLAAST